jgi:type IV pilus assembly protein PilE
MMTNKQTSRGFSLLELMIVVAVIAVLSAIALPSYRQYVLRSHRTDATQALQDLASREENYFFSNSAYTATLSNLGYNNATLPSADYQVQVAAASSTDYTVQATPIGTQTKDTACKQFSLNHAGQQTSQGTATGPTCWGSQ